MNSNTSKDEIRWFLKTIESLVSNPEQANIGRRRGYFDLEILIVVAPEDEALFTDEVLDALITLVRAKTGMLCPVIYLENKPNAKAKEQLDYAYSQV